MKVYSLYISLLSLLLFSDHCAPTDAVYLPSHKVTPSIPGIVGGEALEGYCIVQFDVSVVGSVLNPTVLECAPHGVFEDTSIEAIKQFLYSPRVVNGEAVIVKSVLQKFLFPPERELEKYYGLPFDIGIKVDVPN